MILAKGSPQVLVRTMYSYTHSFHVLSRNASQWCNTTWVQCLQWSKLESSIEWFLNVAYQAVHNGEQLWCFWVCGNSLFLWNPAILWFQTLEIGAALPVLPTSQSFTVLFSPPLLPPPFLVSSYFPPFHFISLLLPSPLTPFPPLPPPPPFSLLAPKTSLFQQNCRCHTFLRAVC